MKFLRFKLIIAYHGGHFSGWQAQRGVPSVQETIEVAMRNIFPSVDRLQGSSRTDEGVHALGMVAHVDILESEWKMTEVKLPLAINAFLPHEIRVLSAEQCGEEFHARFDAVGKQYRYLIWNHPGMNPLMHGIAWHVPKPLDVAAMHHAAPLFLGQHDFKSLAGTRPYALRSTVRTLTRCELEVELPLLTVFLEGDAFLYKMCRNIVGTLVQVGEKKIDGSTVPEILKFKDRRYAGMTAPAHGLMLAKVFYPGESWETLHSNPLAWS